jgi:hypothetical protein
MTKIKQCKLKRNFFLSMPNAEIHSTGKSNWYWSEYDQMQDKWTIKARPNGNSKVPFYLDPLDKVELKLLNWYTTETSKIDSKSSYNLRLAANRFNEEIDEIERIFGKCTLQKLSL